jgi:hypothetical protein
MNLQSARELKARLLSDVRTAAASTDADRPVSGGFAAGIAARPDGGYAVAIRLPADTSVADALVDLAERFGDDLDVRTVGTIRPQRANPAGPDVSVLQSRQRPLYPGLSISHPDVTAGTLGGFVQHDGRLHLLSNSHVLADSGLAAPGDAALQPGVADGGDPGADAVGVLAALVPFDSEQPNLMDVALAVVGDDVDADPSAYPGGPVTGVATDPPADGLVQKVGRTTGLTAGRVTAFEVDGITVEYDVGPLTFDNQIEIEGADDEPFSDGGDSGSVIWTTTDRQAFGLLFAASATGGSNGRGLTYANPLSVVLAELVATWVSAPAVEPVQVQVQVDDHARSND